MSDDASMSSMLRMKWKEPNIWHYEPRGSTRHTGGEIFGPIVLYVTLRE